MTSRVGDYLLRETLGTGAFGKVRRAVHQTTGKHYAIKIMDKALIRNQELTLNVRREIAIMKAFNHPNIVSVHNVLTSKTRLYVVLDLVRGPELFEVIAKRGTGGLPEREARKYFQNLIDGVDYCHRRGVCHRDLKPENLLVDHDGNLKITDFGLSSMKGANTTTDLLTTQCGTPNYIAPEIISCLNPRYDGQKVDAWACGIILYALLAGYLPFDETDLAHLFEVIQKGHIEFPHWFSAGARDLIWRLLCVDPSTRSSVHQVKQHPWFLVNYQLSPRTGITSAGAKRRRRRSRVSKSMDEVRMDSLAAQATAPPQQSLDLPISGNIPVPPTLSMEFPTLQLPTHLCSVSPDNGKRNTSATAVAAAETARMEMIRSRRAISFSKKYSLLRKGTVNYGGLEIGVSSFRGPTTLGGEHQARLRGVLSACNSSLAIPRRDADTVFNPIESNVENGETSRPSILNNEDASQQRDTIQAIQSLRNVISASQTMLQAADDNDKVGAENHQIREATLKALRRLRDELQMAESRFGELKGGQLPGYNPHCPAIMSPSQRKDTIRLLDVWESRILNDFDNERESDDTRVTEQEISAFQSLLQMWETHLDGEDLVEDVLIPGSETVDDESPATTVPDRFLDTCNFLRHIECRRKVGNRFGRFDKRCDSLFSSRIPMLAESNTASCSGPRHIHFGTEKVDAISSSSQDGGDLAKLWNHVLVANTSTLENPQDSWNPDHEETEVVEGDVSEEPTSSPVTDWHPSPYSTEGSDLGVGEAKGVRDHSRTSSGSLDMVTTKIVERCRLPPSPRTCRKAACRSPSARDSSRPERPADSLGLLKTIKSYDFVSEPPLVRSHAQRQIRVYSTVPQTELEPVSSENLGRGSQGEKDRCSGSLRAKTEQLRSSDNRADRVDSLLPMTRRYKFLHIRSKYSTQFESGYDPRICFRELGRLMEKEGIDVSRKHGHKTLRVRVPGPRKNQLMTASFDFQARGHMGSVVHFKKISGDRSMSRSEEEKILSAFLGKVLDEFSDSEPGFAVLTRS